MPSVWVLIFRQPNNLDRILRIRTVLIILHNYQSGVNGKSSKPVSSNPDVTGITNTSLGKKLLLLYSDAWLVDLSAILFQLQFISA